MKIQEATKRETLHIAAGTLAFSAVMNGVFALLGRWDLTVLWGTLLGGGFAVLNFFLLGLTVQKMAGDPNEKKRQARAAALVQPAHAGHAGRGGAGRKAGVLFVGGYGDPAAVPAAYHSCNADPGHVQTAQK